MLRIPEESLIKNRSSPLAIENSPQTQLLASLFTRLKVGELLQRLRGRKRLFRRAFEQQSDLKCCALSRASLALFRSFFRGATGPYRSAKGCGARDARPTCINPCATPFSVKFLYRTFKMGAKGSVEAAKINAQNWNNLEWPVCSVWTREVTSSAGILPIDASCPSLCIQTAMLMGLRRLHSLRHRPTKGH
ncbi:hypothetical protein TcasGA2_TC013481 [Tribolium castaneum]|uniref:Uncharacterized protein n=1 Tax=Tribolium castaneum TaxID=7070 RepID=D6WL96_TRICA|nr:hypothetical protein TcasGA2_TC013481 [Tribolium castaneum]